MTSHFCLASSNEASQPPGSYIALHFAHLLSSSLQEFWVVLPSSCMSCSYPELRPGLEAPCSVAVALHALQHSPARTGSYFPLAMCYYLVGCLFFFFFIYSMILPAILWLHFCVLSHIPTLFSNSPMFPYDKV